MKANGTAAFNDKTKNLSKCDWVVSEILSQISSGKLTPGDRLPPENDLATMFGVSRVTVRESIKKLSMLDIVEVRRGDGSFVKQAMFSNIFESLYPILMFENKTIAEIYDVRAIIEGGAAYLASLHRTEADLEDLHVLYEKMEEAVKQDDTALFSQYDIQFHIRIAKASQNAILKTITAVLYDVWADCIGKTNYTAPIISASHKAHNNMLDAIEGRQQTLASAIMRSHICTASKNLLQRLEKDAKSID